MEQARRALWIAVLAMSALLAGAGVSLHAARASAASAVEAAQQLLQREDDAVIRGDEPALASVFTASATRSLLSAVNRLHYVQDWANARGVRFLRVHVEVAPRSVQADARGDAASMAVTVSEAFTYAWRSGPATPQTFGLGTRRRLDLVQVGGIWRIASQVFIDPLDQETRLPGPATPGHAVYHPAPLADPGPRAGYDPQGAVRYADTYCGAAPGCGNGGMYNPEYQDYNAEGGDCTNFASQVLHAGGGIPEDGTWYHVRGSGGDGSIAWVRAGSLLAFILARGRGSLMAQGTFAQLVTPGPDGHAAADRLAPGDLIAYFEAGRVVHFGLVVGRDVGGYPVVDTHTADRYHVPWDLGWDASTRFLFVRLGNAMPTPAALQLAAQVAAAPPGGACGS
jgi:hypothetical protein